MLRALLPSRVGVGSSLPAAIRLTQAAAAAHQCRLTIIGAERMFSSKAPRTRVEVHPATARQAAKSKKKGSKAAATATANGESIETEIILEEEEMTTPNDQSSGRTITLTGELLSSSSSLGALHGPTTTDSFGRHVIRTKYHPEGAIVGRGRVVANFGTRMLVQEVPWEEEAETHTAGMINQPNEIGMAKAGEQPPTAAEDGARFICQPRGSKLGKIVCGDVVLWEWNANMADSAAFIVEVKPRRTTFQRVDKSSKTGRDQVLLASNFHHMCIVCAPQPATNGMLLDRYLAAASRMGVSASIIFNKIDLPEAANFKEDMEDYRRIGIPVFETSCEKTKDTSVRGIDALRKHLAQVGPNGKPGITIFVGQSGSGKSSLLNALSPSLQLRVNDLSRNHQGRHTTTQTILHQLESGGEIIDSPGFQNYTPAPIPLREVADGFKEFAEPAKCCHYGRRCLHVTEPSCGVRLAVRSSARDAAIAAELDEADEHAPSFREAVDPRATIVAAYQNLLLSGVSSPYLPDDPDSPVQEQKNMSAGERQKRKEWSAPTRRDRLARIDDLAVESQRARKYAMNDTAPVNTFQDTLDEVQGHPHLHGKQVEVVRQLIEHKLIDTISKRRYESYVALIQQQQELEKRKYR